MTTTSITVPVATIKVRAGDVIRFGDDVETITAVGGIDNGVVAVRTHKGVRFLSTREDVPALVPVSHPSDATGLYKADGSGIFGCTCVYRVVDTRLPHESVAEDPGCPSHGADRLDDDEWD